MSTKLRFRKIQKEGVAVVKLCVDKICSNSVSSGEVKRVSYSPKVTDR